MKPTVFIISAPSGSGKTTLANLLREQVPGLLFSVSYTTRKQRGSEQDGREYYFVARAEFEKMLAADEFLEHAEVHGNYYGTPRRFLREAEQRGQDLLLDIDVQGEEQIKAKIPEAVAIFVLPPSKEVLERRLKGRSYAEKIASGEANLHGRLLAAAREVEKYPNYDYILVNDRLERSIEQLKAIVLSERARRSGGKLSSEDRQAAVTAEECRQEKMGARLKPILASFALSAAPSGSPSR
ncbi:MAG: guanylate kinase [Terriglobales bacterium]